MRVRYNWIGIFALIMSSIALAEQVPSTTSVDVEKSFPKTDAERLIAQKEGEKITARADQQLDVQEIGEAMKLYIQAAELNYVPAQVKLGELANFSQYYETAVGWFLMAAMQGDAAGQYNLGLMYLAGHGIEQDDSKAAFWIRRSAAKNFTLATKAIANAYRSGDMGVKIDIAQANEWESRAKLLTERDTREVSKKLEKFKEDSKALAKQEVEDRQKLIEEAEKNKK